MPLVVIIRWKIWCGIGKQWVPNIIVCTLISVLSVDLFKRLIAVINMGKKFKTGVYVILGILLIYFFFLLLFGFMFFAQDIFH